MTNKEILRGNKFANMTYDDLQLMWDGLKRFYEYGCFAWDNPLRPYKQLYCEESPVGIMRVEQDLLRAIACKMFEE